MVYLKTQGITVLNRHVFEKMAVLVWKLFANFSKGWYTSLEKTIYQSEEKSIPFENVKLKHYHNTNQEISSYCLYLDTDLDRGTLHCANSPESLEPSAAEENLNLDIKDQTNERREYKKSFADYKYQ